MEHISRQPEAALPLPLFIFFKKKGIGYNFKFTELQACIGIEQMRKVPERVARKKAIWERYLQGLRDCPQVRLFKHNVEHTAPWFIDCCVQSKRELQAYLKSNDIGSRDMYPPINKQECYQQEGEHDVSNWVGREGLWLPSAVQLTDAEIDLICDHIKYFYNTFRGNN
jgi:perosamine synthetase